jgi:hypothetical protein
MQAILKLDLAGQPRGWMTLQEAVSAYARGDVVYGIGETAATGLRRHPALPGNAHASTCSRSSPWKGASCRASPLRCAIAPCSAATTIAASTAGRKHTRSELTRDHVLPLSRGGSDRWENVVAACKRCNWQKDSETPEEAGMPLLAVPFRPNTYEWHYLAKDRILADQMEYLSQQFRAQRDWAH